MVVWATGSPEACIYTVFCAPATAAGAAAFKKLCFTAVFVYDCLLLLLLFLLLMFWFLLLLENVSQNIIKLAMIGIQKKITENNLKS